MLPPHRQKAAKKAYWHYWPRRILSERGIAVFLLIIALVMMLSSGFAPKATDQVRITVLNQLHIVLTTMTTPVQKISTMIQHMTGLSDMARDVEALREENMRLRQWYDRARQLEAENRSLRSLVHLADLPKSHYVTARVIAESGGPFAQSAIVDAGEDEGIKPNSVAMTGDGVVGRVMTVGNSIAHVLLLTDVNSRVPVVIENSRHRGMLTGDNSAQPMLMYLPEDSSVSVGERVMTSGHGGLFAPGLPVGVVASVKQGEIRVQPFADMRRLDFMQLIDFGRSDLLPADTLSQKGVR